VSWCSRRGTEDLWKLRDSPEKSPSGHRGRSDRPRERRELALRGRVCFRRHLAREALQSVEGLRNARCLTCAILSRSAHSRIASAAIEVLFNCAARCPAHGATPTNPERWKAPFDLNVNIDVSHDPRVSVRAWGVQAPEGSSSTRLRIAGSVTGVPDRWRFGRDQGRRNRLTKSVAANSSARCRCTPSAPGTSNTVAAGAHCMRMALREDAQRVRSRVSPGRFATGRDARVALYLATDESGFTTGKPRRPIGGWMN
jgi:2-keto-3-deoxy-L-fuconate dehydrogenase